MVAARDKALRGGAAGMAAMSVQVCSLMWLRTTMNYQYRHGLNTSEAISLLYKQGGVSRFYQGLLPALLQGPLSRFGDTAANAGAIALLDSYDETRCLPSGIKSVASSSAASLFRLALMPVDTVKTIMQVEGKQGLPILWQKARVGGPRTFFQGGFGAVGATFIGHYPWFATYNLLNTNINLPEDRLQRLLRNAGIGFACSFVSDCTSNSVRVVKTTKQTFATEISYREAAAHVVKQDGLVGLFTRGLKTRLLANGVQGMMFTVLWKNFEEQLGASATAS